MITSKMNHILLYAKHIISCYKKFFLKKIAVWEKNGVKVLTKPSYAVIMNV